MHHNTYKTTANAPPQHFKYNAHLIISSWLPKIQSLHIKREKEREGDDEGRKEQWGWREREMCVR